MKHFFIFLILCITLALATTYNRARTTELGEQLITDAYFGDLLAVKEDLEKGAPLGFEMLIEDENRNYHNRLFNLLHAAASSGNEDLILFALAQGFEINYPTPDGWTPLFIAVRDGQSEAAKLLIYREANVNAQTDLGATPLHMAATQPFSNEQERLNLISYLIEHGADTTLADFYGNTPLYYAQQLNLTEAVALLQNSQTTR